MNSNSSTWLKPAGALVAAGALIFGMTGCNGCGSNAPVPITSAANGPDPADANLATSDGGQPTQVLGQSQAYTPQQSSETYSNGQQAPAPIVAGTAYNGSQQYNTQPNDYYDNGQGNAQQGYYDNGAPDAYAQTDQAPPELPVYEQPPAPDDNDIWTPGYWGYANTGYYWVPGAWVSAPYVGALWTPGWWGFGGGHYRWNRGYWGRHIGYYGGINYGYGYVGSGYYGGYWNNDRFYYNRAVTRVSPRVRNIYDRNVVVNNVRYNAVSNNRISFNGGRGGVNYQPRPYEVAAMHEQHVGPLPAQQQFHREAAENRGNFYSDNHGRPAQVALAQPIRTERIAAPAETSRGGFGRGAAVGQPGVVGVNPHTANEQQRGLLEQQRNTQLQQHNQVEQQRGLMEQQRNINEQQRNVQLQQHNQSEQQRNQLAQQHGVIEQQRNQQLQQHNNALEQQRAVQVQRNQAEGQRNQVEQQRGLMEQQRNQQLQQRNAAQQQQLQQRAAPAEQMRHVPEQRQVEQRQFQPQQQPRVEQPRPQVAPQQHMEQPRQQMAPQQHMEAPRAAPAPHVEAPRAAPAAHMEASHAGGEGGHPGGGHH